MILSVGRRPGANTEGSGTGAGGFRRAGDAFFLLLRRRFLLTDMMLSHHFADGCAGEIASITQLVPNLFPVMPDGH